MRLRASRHSKPLLTEHAQVEMVPEELTPAELLCHSVQIYTPPIEMFCLATPKRTTGQNGDEAGTGSLSLLTDPASNNVRLAVKNQSEIRSVEVFDVNGARVRQLAVDGVTTRDFDWDGTDDTGRPMAVGTYFIRVRTDDRIESAKLVMTR